MNGNYKFYVNKLISDDYFLTIIGMASVIGIGISKFIWAFLFRKTGFKTVLLTIIVTSIVIYATLKTT